MSKLFAPIFHMLHCSWAWTPMHTWALRSFLASISWQASHMNWIMASTEHTLACENLIFYTSLEKRDPSGWNTADMVASQQLPMSNLSIGKFFVKQQMHCANSSCSKVKILENSNTKLNEFPYQMNPITTTLILQESILYIYFSISLCVCVCVCVCVYIYIYIYIYIYKWISPQKFFVAHISFEIFTWL